MGWASIVVAIFFFLSVLSWKEGGLLEVEQFGLFCPVDEGNWGGRNLSGYKNARGACRAITHVLDRSDVIVIPNLVMRFCSQLVVVIVGVGG